jgi:hypothetical protein
VHPQLRDVTRFGTGTGLTDAIETLKIAEKPYDDTALCVTIRDAHEYLLNRADPDRINAVVVLSDGVNDYPDPCRMEDLPESISQLDSDHRVKVFGVGFGGQASMAALRTVSNATGAPALDATDPARLDSVLGEIFRAVSTGT